MTVRSGAEIQLRRFSVFRSSLLALKLHVFDNRAKKVVEALKRLERLGRFDELDESRHIRMLGCDLNVDLQILTDIGLEHLAQSFEQRLDSELAKVVGHHLAWNKLVCTVMRLISA